MTVANLKRVEVLMPKWLLKWLIGTLTATLLIQQGSAVAAEHPAVDRSSGVIQRSAADTGRVEARQTRRFWVHDKHRYTSPWYAGARRKMIAFGCTRAPFYDPDPRCTKRHGYHHGLDLAMPCGTPLYAAFRTRVVRPSSSGSLGSAYGDWAFRLRSGRFHKDFVIGHVRRVFVDPGELVRRGQLIAKASDAGAPDGCHLHFEVRPRGAGYQSAVAPYRYLRLARAE